VQFRGVIPAIASPCDSRDDFDEQSFARLAAALLAEKVDGLYVCGLTGEGYQLTIEERQRAVEVAVRISEQRTSVLAHVGTQDTRVSCRLAAHAAAAGASGVAAIPPVCRTFAEIEAYYRALADAAGGLPVFIYHIPVFTKWEATYEQLARLSDLPGIAGIKFTDYNLLLMRRLLAMRPDFTVLYGRDEQFAAALAMGSHGGVGSTYNVFPAAFVSIRDAVQAGDLALAFRIQCILTDVIAMMERFGVLACIEAILARTGFGSAVRRRPCQPLSAAAVSEMWALLPPLIEALPSSAQPAFLKEM
jgi:N-acetylneuraminate lyase